MEPCRCLAFGLEFGLEFELELELELELEVQMELAGVGMEILLLPPARVE
jgi:hypothetical protein